MAVKEGEIRLENEPSSDQKPEIDYADPHLAAFEDNPDKPQKLTMATFMAIFVNLPNTGLCHSLTPLALVSGVRSSCSCCSRSSSFSFYFSGHRDRPRQHS